MKRQAFILLIILLNAKNSLSSSTVNYCRPIDADKSHGYSNPYYLYCEDHENIFNGYSDYYHHFFDRENGYSVHELKVLDCDGLDERISTKFPSIQFYDVSGNGIQTISGDDLYFRNLNILIASFNQLNSFSENMFVHTPDITKIDFSHNKFVELLSDDFISASKLTSIDFSSNQISIISSDTFSTLGELRSLDLSDNLIETVETDWFQNNNQLQKLNLKDNSIRRFDENIFAWIENLYWLKLEVSCENVGEFDSSSLGKSLVIRTKYDDIDNFAESEGSFPDVPDINTEKMLSMSVEFRSEMRCTLNSFENLTYFNISGNDLEDPGDIFHILGSSIETLDMSSSFSDYPTISLEKYTNLKYLDLSNTFLSDTAIISSSDSSYLQHNKQLKTIRLENNPIARLGCNFFSLLMDSVTVRVSCHSLAEIYANCAPNSITIDVNDDGVITFRTSNSGFELQCNKVDFQHLVALNVSGNNLQNTKQIIGLLGPEIQSLDASLNFVGKLNEHTFERCTNLKYLHLRQTNLSNFQFSTFYHLRHLETLDISYNHLGSVKFSKLFLRNFRDLMELNLEGNDLIEVDNITQTIFPKLKVLGISKNRFECSYLAEFLHQWENLKLMDNPSIGSMHIDGTDCYHDDQQSTTKALATSSTTAIIEQKSTTRREFQLTTPTPMITIPTPTIKATTEIAESTKHFDCKAFSVGNLTISCNQTQEIDMSCMKTSVNIVIDSENGTTFRPSQINFNRKNYSEFHCSSKDLENLRFLNISGNQLKSTSKVIPMLSPSMESLDLAQNFIGRLNESTFQRFTNLKYLNLSQTNLSNFGFNTFYHQSKLEVLDISYNHLKNVDFKLLIWNFKNLFTLNLEGNDLLKIDSVTRSIFPRLKLLGISKNRFACQYLAKFLSQWENLELYHNPSNQTHIGGVDCNNSAVTPVTTTKAPLVQNISTKATQHTTKAVPTVTTPLTTPKTMVKITRFDCDSISLKAPQVIVCDSIQQIDTSCMGSSHSIVFNGNDEIIFHSLQNNSQLQCTKMMLQSLKSLNVSGNHLQSTPKILEMLGSEIETLDLAMNFIGRLNESTFKRFSSLKFLNLSQTNLSNFGIDTFHHESKLEVLDISCNHLKSVDFNLFLNNFENLKTLNLEGNDLVDVYSVTSYTFPKLSLLGISKNHFQCDYLVRFLRQWEHLRLYHNSSNQTHIAGVDCYSNSRTTNQEGKDREIHFTSKHSENVINMEGKGSQYTDGLNKSNEHEHTTAAVHHLSTHIQLLEYFILGICAIWCINFVRKSQVIQNMQQKLNGNALERIVVFRQRDHDAQQDDELIEKGSVNA